MATQGMTFGSPVTRDTPVDGMTFGSPVTRDTPVDQFSSQSPQPQPHSGGGFLNTAGDVGAGFLKGAGQTVNTISKSISRIAPSLVRPSDVQALEQIETPTNTAQRVGVVGEGIGEFFLGDEALKGLSLAERLGLATKVARLAESHPVVGKIISAGLKAVRTGAVSGGQAGLHGGDASDIGKAALIGGAASATFHTANELARAAKGAEAASPVENAVGNAVGKAKIAEGAPPTEPPSSSAIQPDLQAGIRKTLSDVAADNGVQAKPVTSIRDAVENTAAAVQAKAKQAYATLDEASGGRWQRFDDQLKNIRMKIREVAGIDDDKHSALELKQSEIETTQANLLDELQANGKITPRLAEEAKTNYKKAQALYDVDAQLKAATTGRAGVGKGVETVDPGKLAPRLHKLFDSGRLQQAVGPDHAAALIEHAENAQAAVAEIKNFEPASATGRNALAELVRSNTIGKSSLLKGGKIEGVTNWNGVVRDFENLAPEKQQAAFSNDVPRVRLFIQRQALKQNAGTLLKRAGTVAAVGGIAAGAGKLAYDALHQ